MDYRPLSGVLNRAAKDAPRVGRTVQVIKGKHRGKEGQVLWHGKDKFSDAFRYCSEASAALREARGTFGFRVRVRTAQGEEFFTSAENVEVVMPVAQSVAQSVAGGTL